MIRLADNGSKTQVWDMWKTCFGDSDRYMELYFHYKYRPENTLLFMDGSKAVASLQMLDYRFTFHGEEIPVIYLSGVCTLPEYRKRGCTRALLIEGFNEAVRREVPLMFLVPQEQWLMELYGRYGFGQTFCPGDEPLPSLKVLMDRHEGDLEAAYGEFDRCFRGQDMTVQKTFDDFRAIAEEAALFNFPEKRSLPGMARVIDAKRLLSIFVSRQNRDDAFVIRVRDTLIARNNLYVRVDEGAVDSGLIGASNEESAWDVDVRLLGQLLLGYRTADMGGSYASVFPEKNPQMHYMLE